MNAQPKLWKCVVSSSSFMVKLYLQKKVCTRQGWWFQVRLGLQETRRSMLQFFYAFSLVCCVLFCVFMYFHMGVFILIFVNVWELQQNHKNNTFIITNNFCVMYRHLPWTRAPMRDKWRMEQALKHFLSISYRFKLHRCVTNYVVTYFLRRATMYWESHMQAEPVTIGQCESGIIGFGPQSFGIAID